MNRNPFLLIYEQEWHVSLVPPKRLLLHGNRRLKYATGYGSLELFMGRGPSAILSGYEGLRHRSGISFSPDDFPVKTYFPHQRTLFEYKQRKSAGFEKRVWPYRGTSLIRNCPPLGPYSRTMPRALWWS